MCAAASCACVSRPTLPAPPCSLESPHLAHHLPSSCHLELGADAPGPRSLPLLKQLWMTTASRRWRKATARASTRSLSRPPPTLQQPRHRRRDTRRCDARARPPSSVARHSFLPLTDGIPTATPSVLHRLHVHNHNRLTFPCLHVWGRRSLVLLCTSPPASLPAPVLALLPLHGSISLPLHRGF